MYYRGWAWIKNTTNGNLWKSGNIQQKGHEGIQGENNPRHHHLLTLTPTRRAFNYGEEIWRRRTPNSQEPQ